MDESNDGDLAGTLARYSLRLCRAFRYLVGMSDLIARNMDPTRHVQQIAYFCNAFPDDAQAPFNDPAYPAKQRDQVKNTRDFLDGPVLTIFQEQQTQESGQFQ